MTENKNDMPELLPCPFCNSEPIVKHFNTEPSYCFCFEPSCSINDVRFDLDDWNTRADLAQPQVDVESLKINFPERKLETESEYGDYRQAVGWNRCLTFLLEKGYLRTAEQRTKTAGDVSCVERK